ncbi:hypothetical protein JOD45_001204 [Scopulibacillus daqui]|uniref:Bacteriocin immunity protein n=1 Tax=Scopulibacillus daqui TaxID=1469162 RepID=A0ABS2PZ49_9BACL|nr:hypothetical protein [Scopulibacillus daqui]MBM7644995.1 hypothetical protein [Scopulibacillus daqui]
MNMNFKKMVGISLLFTLFATILRIVVRNLAGKDQFPIWADFLLDLPWFIGAFLLCYWVYLIEKNKD